MKPGDFVSVKAPQEGDKWPAAFDGRIFGYMRVCFGPDAGNRWMVGDGKGHIYYMGDDRLTLINEKDM